MTLPDSKTSKATDPGGTGRTVRCLVEKGGRRFVVTAQCSSVDAKTDAVTFPWWLFEGDDYFTLIAIEGEPGFESLARNVN